MFESSSSPSLPQLLTGSFWPIRLAPFIRRCRFRGPVCSGRPARPVPDGREQRIKSPRPPNGHLAVLDAPERLRVGGAGGSASAVREQHDVIGFENRRWRVRMNTVIRGGAGGIGLLQCGLEVGGKFPILDAHGRYKLFDGTVAISPLRSYEKFWAELSKEAALLKIFSLLGVKSVELKDKFSETIRQTKAPSSELLLTRETLLGAPMHPAKPQLPK
ncbi:hypothetical protein DL763_005326 [Monosporascus cannonballus]|nr:hypothetical protein DL763_005326 [Monosporascus cannonballus]